MGLITDGENYTILTDIQGMEDALGDMDFKVAGTVDGITAIQMDIKIAGLTKDILSDALQQAHAGRLHIMGKMLECIQTSRPELSAYAPRIITMHIKPDKIRSVIGLGVGGAVVLGAGFLYYAIRLMNPPSERFAMEVFNYSIIYLMALFAFLLVDHYLVPVGVLVSPA